MTGWTGGRGRWGRAARLGAVVAVLGLAACTSSTGTSSPGSPTGSASPTGSTAPGFAATLRPAVADAVDRLHLPGAFVLVSTPEGTFAESFGNREVGLAAPIGTDDHYRIGSITKTMTATVVLQLVAEGKVDLDAPIATYVDGVPDGDQVTVRQLLTMTSGLPEYTNAEQFSDALPADPQRVWRPEELLAIAFDPATTRPAPTPARGTYFYDNTNYVLLGLLIESVTGRTAAEELAARIFEPLGMTSTALPVAADATLPEPHPHGYVFGLPPEPERAVDATGWNPSWAWTAGGVVSTPRDMAVYAEALTDGRLLGGEVQERRLHGGDYVPVGAGDDVGYGLGIVEADGFYGHSGGLFGFAGWALHDPERDITIVLYTTTLATPQEPGPGRALLEAVTRPLLGTVLVPAPPSAAAEDGVSEEDPHS